MSGRVGGHRRLHTRLSPRPVGLRRKVRGDHLFVPLPPSHPPSLPRCLQLLHGFVRVFPEIIVVWKADHR